MRWNSRFAFVAAGALVAYLNLVVRAQSLGLTAGPNGTILKNGATYRGVGVDYFDPFYRTIVNPNDTSYVAGFQALGQHNIPFVRYSATAYYPAELSLYQTNKDEYFRRMDGVVQAAQQAGVGLIPSMFWTYWAVPDLVGEHMDQWGNSNSLTRQFMRSYTTDFVNRYKNSPAIWGWEFGNEFNLNANLPNGLKFLPPIIPSEGTPTSRTTADLLTYAQIRSAFTDFSSVVHQLDPSHRIIETGDSAVRAEAWHNLNANTFETDTPAQQLEMLQGDNPGNIDTVSIHLYGEDIPRLPALASLAQQIGKPLFVGEFGVSTNLPNQQQQFESLLQSIVQGNVSLAAAWVYDSPYDPDYTMEFNNSLAYELADIQAANASLVPEPGPIMLFSLASCLLLIRPPRPLGLRWRRGQIG
jgi:hypothetical protein